MRGVVYVDILFFTNALIGWFLLRCCATLTGYTPCAIGLFAGGVVAGISSLMMLLPPIAGWCMWGLKILGACLIVRIAFWKSTRRVFLHSLFWYIAMNMLLCGIVLLVLYYLEPAGIQVYNMTLYFNVSPLLLIGCVTATYLLFQIAIFFFGKPREQVILRFKTTLGTKQLVGMALWDTGYQIRDPMSGEYTFLVSFPQLKMQLPDTLYQALSEYFSHGTLTEGAGIHLVPARTATGIRLLPAVHAPLLLREKEQWQKTGITMAVFTPEKLGNEAFEALVNPAFAKY